MPFLASNRTKNTKQKVEEANMLPMMNLMVCLIPVLLSAAQFIKIGMIEIDLPTGGAGASGDASGDVPEEVEQKLGLKLFITEKGFTIANDRTVIKDSTGTGPTVPLTADGKYDYEKLGDKLLEISEAFSNKYKDGRSIKIAADNSIEFQVLVNTIDAARTITKDDKTIPMFPQVNFGKL
ncbi:biopolymer transporter ExbD [bacterium]|nr:biopolymer transporter ExbD [bacterium]